MLCSEYFSRFAAADVRGINEPCTAIASIASGSVDVVFMSNFLEHLQTKQLVLDTLRETVRMLRPGGAFLAGLEPEVVVPRFLPYTTKSRLPQARRLVSLYLRIPLTWRVLCKQALVVARKPH